MILPQRVRTSLLIVPFLLTITLNTYLYLRQKGIPKHLKAEHRISRKPWNILLLSYMRSGSTFTADLIQQDPAVVYAFEPLTRFSRAGRYDVDKFCSIISDKFSCRTNMDKEESPDFVRKLFSDFYSCKLLEPNHRFFNLHDKSTSLTAYKRCLKSRGPTCKQEFSKTCIESPKMIKSIRMSMKLAGSIMQLIPNFKLIYLVRDPRAMFISRFRAGLMDFTENRDDKLTHVKEICKYIEKDVKTFMDLKSRFPDRLKILVYEDLVNNPNKNARKLYDFIGISYNKSMDHWLQNHMNNESHANWPFDTLRKNASYSALMWRLSANNRWDDFYDVTNSYCESIFDMLGFTKFKTINEIKNMSIPSWQPNPKMKY